jgi:lipid-binding SYLF domain-containing protein
MDVLQEPNMRAVPAFCFLVLMSLLSTAARPDDYADTVTLFKNAGQSAEFFDKSHGYAVFPTIGKGGLGVGAAHGSGRVYEHGKHVGDAKMNQISVGLQAGGQAYSQIVFFEDDRAFRDFTAGDFAFGADVGAVAITAAASASAGGKGKSAGASGGKNDASSVGGYHKGIAVFTIVKGGAMYEATVAGQKFKYKSLAAKKK